VRNINLIYSHRNPVEFYIRVGSVLLFNGTIHRISKVVKHEKYFPPRIYHDIALITLKKKIKFNDEVSPICLPKRNMLGEDLFNNTSHVSGFGDLSFGGEQAATLQEVDLKVLNNSYCNENYKNLIQSKTKFLVGLKKSLICAGHEKGGKDACQVFQKCSISFIYLCFISSEFWLLFNTILKSY